jgi:ADP-glucose pyrophosphorylase
MAFMQKESQVGSSVGRRARIDPTARVEESILWDDVEVGAGAVMHRCIVTDGVSVPAGANYADAVLVAAADGTVQAALR